MQFRDLKRQYEALKPSMDAAVLQAVSSTDYIGGPQVRQLEERLAAYTGSKHCITCANGTDALSLALSAWGVGPGDAVFVPDFTFFSSGECPAAAGAVPVFTDVKRDSYNMDPEALEQAVEQVAAEGELTPKVVVAVDLFGLAAEYEPLRRICDKYGMYLLEDGAQGFGAMNGQRRACSFGDISTTSFFPAKPLGCYGDGGALFTDDDGLAALLRSLAVHGKHAENKYDNVRIGRNSRLDTIQAAVLSEKLTAFESYELEAVNRAAALYTKQLEGTKGLTLPSTGPGQLSSWAQYTVQLPEGTDRTAVRNALKEKGIPTMVYYEKPMHLQGAFQGTKSAQAHCPVTEDLCGRVLCLPVHPYLTPEEICMVAGALKEALCQ